MYTTMIYAVGFQNVSFHRHDFSLNRKEMDYGVQSPPRQSSSSVYSLYLGAKGKSHWRGATELAWTTIL